jgi:DNA-binding GntR family transcriptional regulator
MRNGPSLEYQTKQEIIYRELYDGIVAGRYQPGERLDLRDIAEWAGTSRTPVREAVRRLESEGIVTSIPHHGFIVSKFPIEEIIELYHIRAVLEGLAARLAAANVTEANARALRKYIRDMESAVQHGHPEKMLKANRPFHDIIYKASNSPLLYKYIISLYVRTARYRGPLSTWPGRPDEIVAEHRALAEAVIAGDADEAERLARAHHENNAQAAVKLAESLAKEGIPAT